MTSVYSITVLPVLLGILIRYFIGKYHARSIATLPGPSSRSWLVGNLPDLYRPENIGDADFEWTRSYGSAVRIKGAFGSDILFTADPKCLQYILNTSGYNFPKPADTRLLNALFLGQGLSWAEGDQHARHRKIMSPAFSHSSLKEFLPLFNHTAQKTVSKWRDLISQSGSTSFVVDVPGWISRTTLDAIGEAAFDYSFNAIDEEKENILAKAYNNLFAETFHDRSDSWLAFESMWNFLPQQSLSLIRKIPSKMTNRLNGYMKIARGIAQSLVDRQIQSYEAGTEGGKDVMSILVRANLSEDPKTQLSDDEILDQLTTLMLGGHESTASMITWTIHELSRHPTFQKEVREEIKAIRNRAAQRGAEELNTSDLDSMSCMLALVKETLRYHPIIHALVREAGRDDVLPLSAPQKTRTGGIITGVPVSRGQRIVLSLAAYNRHTSIWGDDADEWNPQRFLDGVEQENKTSIGVLANIGTFSSGLRSCIGWRFAMIEMQAILIELIENFEFSSPPGDIEIIRGAAGIMYPMVKGSKTGRSELPVTITALR